MNHVLYFYFDRYNGETVLMDRYTGERSIDLRPLELLRKECLKNGTSLEGARESFRYWTAARKKIPICISGWRRLIFIPCGLPRDPACVFINFSQISRLHTCAAGTRIEFYGGRTLIVDASQRSLKRQCLRCEQFLEKIING